jgi:AbrB family looped-hinge helix DNA binding protein
MTTINAMITTVTGKNQITIPAKLARQLAIQPGTRLDWALGEDGVLLVRPLPSRGELARRTAGMGRAWLPEGVDPVADLVEERLRDEAAEEQK